MGLFFCCKSKEAVVVHEHNVQPVPEPQANESTRTVRENVKIVKIPLQENVQPTKDPQVLNDFGYVKDEVMIERCEVSQNIQPVQDSQRSQSSSSTEIVHRADEHSENVSHRKGMTKNEGDVNTRQEVATNKSEDVVLFDKVIKERNSTKDTDKNHLDDCRDDAHSDESVIHQKEKDAIDKFIEERKSSEECVMKEDDDTAFYGDSDIKYQKWLKEINRLSEEVKDVINKHIEARKSSEEFVVKEDEDTEFYDVIGEQNLSRDDREIDTFESQQRNLDQCVSESKMHMAQKSQPKDWSIAETQNVKSLEDRTGGVDYERCDNSTREGQTGKGDDVAFDEFIKERNSMESHGSDILSSNKSYGLLDVEILRLSASEDSIRGSFAEETITRRDTNETTASQSEVDIRDTTNSGEFIRCNMFQEDKRNINENEHKIDAALTMEGERRDLECVKKKVNEETMTIIPVDKSILTAGAVELSKNVVNCNIHLNDHDYERTDSTKVESKAITPFKPSSKEPSSTIIVPDKHNSGTQLSPSRSITGGLKKCDTPPLVDKTAAVRDEEQKIRRVADVVAERCIARLKEDSIVHDSLSIDKRFQHVRDQIEQFGLAMGVAKGSPSNIGNAVCDDEKGRDGIMEHRQKLTKPHKPQSHVGDDYTGRQRWKNFPSLSSSSSEAESVASSLIEMVVDEINGATKDKLSLGESKEKELENLDRKLSNVQLYACIYLVLDLLFEVC